MCFIEVKRLTDFDKSTAVLIPASLVSQSVGSLANSSHFLLLSHVVMGISSVHEI